jgi:hypothetical protein
MILRFKFTIRVYIMYSVSCQKSIFDNFGNQISRHHTYFKNINVHIQVFHILHDHTMKLLQAFKSILIWKSVAEHQQLKLVRWRLKIQQQKLIRLCHRIRQQKLICR